jgi:hypothetical protein
MYYTRGWSSLRNRMTSLLFKDKNLYASRYKLSFYLSLKGLSQKKIFYCRRQALYLLKSLRLKRAAILPLLENRCSAFLVMGSLF